MVLSKKAKKIEKAYKELQYLSQDEKARAEYDEYIEAQILENMKINYAKENGIKEGIEKGIEQGKIYNIPYNIPIDVDTIKEGYPILCA